LRSTQIERGDDVRIDAGDFPDAAQRYGTDVKALVKIGGVTLLEIALNALRDVPNVKRLAVIGPRSVQKYCASIDRWIDEHRTEPRFS